MLRDRLKKLMLLFCVLSVCCFAETTLKVQGHSSGQEATAEIVISGEESVGALDATVVFAPEVLRFVGASAGGVAEGAMVVARESAPGQVEVALMSGSGLATDGVAVTIRFEVLKPDQSNTSIKILSARGHHNEKLLEIPLKTLDGDIVLDSGVESVSDSEAESVTESLTGTLAALTADEKMMAGGVLALVVLLLLTSLRRRR